MPVRVEFALKALKFCSSMELNSTKSDSQMPVLKGFASRWKVEAAGIEPASREVFMMASTCVVDYLIFAAPAPVDRVWKRLARNLFN